MATTAGKVFLVGAGPGDPELLTVKAVRLIESADVVVYDRLIGDGVLDLIKPGTARLYVGKETGRHTIPQAQINELLATAASSGRRVVRLKGGDPQIFGRVGEEVEHLLSRGIECEIVPGVTAASGCAAELSIPLTHRGLATGVRFVTGHGCDDRPLDLDWNGLADPTTTLAVYMGLERIGEVAARLAEAGLDPATPAIAIASGTTAARRQCVARLAELPRKVAEAGLRSPVLLVIGKVVRLARVPAEVPVERVPAGLVQHA